LTLGALPADVLKPGIDEAEKIQARDSKLFNSKKRK
jgi:hypothetical protein